MIRAFTNITQVVPFTSVLLLNYFLFKSCENSEVLVKVENY